MKNAVVVVGVLALFAVFGCAGGGGTKEVATGGEGQRTTVQSNEGFEKTIGPAEINFQSAMQFIASGNYEEAISHLRTATSLKPNYTEAWAQLGNTYTKLKDYQNAINAYQRALENNPENMEYVQSIAYGYLYLNNLDKAEEYYLKLVQKDSLSYEGNVHLGFIYQKKNDIDAAIRHYELALKAQPDDATTMGTLSGLYEKKGDEAKRFEYLKKAVEAAPDNYKFQTQLGAAYMKNKDYANAIPVFETLVKNYPDQPAYHQNLGLALSQVPERKAEAAAELEKTLQLKGSDAYVSGVLAQLYNDLKQYEKAIETVKKGLSGGGDQEPMLNYQWGVALSKLGQYDEAITMFQKVVATKDPVWTDAANKQIARQVALKKRAEAAKGD